MIFTFGPEFRDTTPSGEKNFIWAVKRYFNVINADFKDATKQAYFEDYTGHIFAYINKSKPINTYKAENIQGILNQIKQYSGLSDVTIDHTFRHLLYRPCKYYFDEFSQDDNPLWGCAYSSEYIGKSTQGGLRLLKRSFTTEEDTMIFNELMLHPETENGENCGLTISYCNGTRNNESCGLNFQDWIQMRTYPGRYYLRITETTQLHSNKLKAGGKTYNAPRYVPTTAAFDQYIVARMEYLKCHVNFPIENEDGIFNSVLDLPIACRGINYTRRCSSDDLSKAGRILFRDKIHMREQDFADFDAARLAAIDEDVIEEDATTYSFRRHTSTNCYNLGFSSVERQYYMGHKIEDPRYRRSDFVDEDYLFAISKKLEKITLNRYNQH